VQLGFDETREKRLTKGQVGHLRRKSVPFLRILREFRTKSIVDYLGGLLHSHKRMEMHGVVHEGYLPCIRVLLPAEERTLTRIS
jgi:hypothetical protein